MGHKGQGPDGKQLSGAAETRLRRAREEKERQAELVRREGLVPGSRPDLDAYQKLGPPPEDVTLGAEWTVRVAMLALAETIADPVITAPERRRSIADLVGKIGQISQKAQLQSKVKNMREKLDAEARGEKRSVSDESVAQPNLDSQPRGLRAKRQ